MTHPALTKSIAIAVALLAGAATPAFASHHGGTHGTSAGTTTPTKETNMSTKDIVDTAVAAGQFNTLAAALGAADLVQTLKGPGPFTVFAPTDAAFAALPAGTVENLLKPENKAKLAAILAYHVVAGKVTSTEVVKLSEADSVGGPKLEITTQGGKVMINDATVTQADIETSNGVIHVIDKVLIPAG
ncbi:MAG: fasciclin domain-containing protein [Pseudoxanthomonas sp.]